MARRSLLWTMISAPLAWAAKVFYRLRVLDAERIPKGGGAVLIANHLSEIDPVILQLAVTRPLRFVFFDSGGQGCLFRWACRLSGGCVISADRPLSGIRLAAKAASSGDLVCIFPEGDASRTGQLMSFNRTFAFIARKASVPIIPVIVDGLWGSIFSYAQNRLLWKSPRIMPTPVCVAVGRAIQTDKAGLKQVRQTMLDLGADAFERRPALGRHLGREVVRSLARRPWAVVVVDRTAERRPVTAAQLLAASAVLSARIRSTVPDLRVGVVLPPGAGALIANLAVLCAGKVPVNLNFTAGRSAVESSLASAGVRTVISADALKAKLPAFPWPEHTVDLSKEMAAEGGRRAAAFWLAAAWLLPNQWVASLLGLPRLGDQNEAVLLFTSGSSGEPKGVSLTHRNILANCAQISSLSILPESATMLGCLPPFHSFGFTVTGWYPLLRGCRLVTVPSPLDSRKMVDAIRDERVSVLVAAPTFVRPLLKKASADDLKSLDIVVTGAERLPEELRQSFLETFHLEILQGYGLTETSPVSSVNQPNIFRTTGDPRPQVAKKTGTVGRLLPGMSARIVDPDTGRELALTDCGMLWLRGANIFGGYLNDFQRTLAVLKDGWFVTGDVARFDEDGFLSIEGRLSRFSKIAGEMVPHVTVELAVAQAFMLDPGEAVQAAIVGLPDPSKGEVLAVVATFDLSTEQLRSRLSEAGLSNLWIPKKVVRIQAMPMLGSGKLDLAACRRLAMES